MISAEMRTLPASLRGWWSLRRPLHRTQLLALGWSLAALLPLVGLGLIAAEYLHYQENAHSRTRLVTDAIERQLRDRLFLVSRQLYRASRPEDLAVPWVLPMTEISRRRVSDSERDIPDRLLLGEPVRAGDRWEIPVSQRFGDVMITARIDAEVFLDVVGGYPLGPSDFVSLIHERGAIIARSVDNDQVVGQRIVDSGMFSDAHRGRREGRYTGKSVVDGIEREFSYRRLEKLPLAVMVGVENRSLVQIWARPALAILLVTLLLASAWGWLVRRFDQAQSRQARLIVDLQSAMQATRATDERLRQAHTLALLGEYEWDPATDTVAIFGETARIFGFDPSATHVSGAAFRAAVDLGDQAGMRRLLEVPAGPGSTAEQQLLIVRPDGTLRHVLARSTRTRTSDGRDVVHGIQQDITELADARERAVRAEAQYRFLFEHNPLPMWLFDRDTLKFVAVNDAMVAHYGYSGSELVGRSMLSIRPEADADAFREAARLPVSAQSQGRVWTHLHKDGRVMRMAVFIHDVDFNGSTARLVAAQDVTEREQAEQRFRLVARATSDAVYDYDLTTGRIWWSESYYTGFGYPPAPFETADLWSERVAADDRERVIASLSNAIEGTESEWQEQYRFRRGNGSLATVLDRGFVLRDATGQPLRIVGGMLDISERQHYEDQLAYRATHDELTGLPNRQLLQDRLQQGILNAQRYGRGVALIFIDLDDFKLVNDSLGHGAGDVVLKDVAARLSGVARETDTVARFGGDEFVLVLTEQDGVQGISAVLARITEALAAPFVVSGSRHSLTASIGWCRYPDAGQDAESLLKHGDLAMYQAKRQGRNRAVAFHSEFADGMSRRLQLVSELRLALEQDQFVPVFQPLFDREGRAVALETLARWEHPVRGLLLPGEFIPVCEESGLIADLGRRILHQAARHYRRLAEHGLGHLRIAVNVSPAQFNDELVRDVAQVLREHQIPSDVLELEITEGLLMADPERAIELMNQIAAMGVSFSVDDFGTGYSSLAYLKRFPIDRLKIDRSFVRDLGTDDDDAAICNSIIGLAHALGIRTVAEGVETTMQLDWLRARQIDEVQGYLLGRPQSFDVLVATLQAR
ncbi:EAL domain-containing protein [Lysobacter korlensis]|uniref:EAL domain-containing protein n=1 Tax=Lysobacter korlensis TaxID=553636 RepID=A0ABV6RKU1_9GAMM